MFLRARPLLDPLSPFMTRIGDPSVRTPRWDIDVSRSSNKQMTCCLSFVHLLHYSSVQLFVCHCACNAVCVSSCVQCCLCVIVRAILCVCVQLFVCHCACNAVCVSSCVQLFVCLCACNCLCVNVRAMPSGGTYVFEINPKMKFVPFFTNILNNCSKSCLLNVCVVCEGVRMYVSNPIQGPASHQLLKNFSP